MYACRLIKELLLNNVNFKDSDAKHFLTMLEVSEYFEIFEIRRKFATESLITQVTQLRYITIN